MVRQSTRYTVELYQTTVILDINSKLPKNIEKKLRN